MNIPDECWTTEVPTECGPYMMRIDNGEYVADSVVNVIGFHWEPGEPKKIVIAGGDITPKPVPREAKFCRLAPVAEVEQLKADNEKLRGWVQDAYGEGRYSTAHWDASTTRARLEGRSE